LKRTKSILFYLPELNNSWGGVRQYSINLLSALSNQSEFTVFIYNEKLQEEMLSGFINKHGFQFVNSQHLKSNIAYLWKLFFLKVRNRLMSFFPKEIRRLESPEKLILNTLCKKYKIPLIHTPYQFLPACTVAKRITTMHDVQEIYFPEYFDAESRAYRATNYLHTLRKADAVVVSFEHIKNDLIKYFQVPENLIQIIPPDFTQLWIKDYLHTTPVDRQSLSLPSKYIFYPANYWPHKNHKRLIEAIALVKRDHPDIHLMLSGYGTDNSEALNKQINDLRLNDSITLAGLVSTEILFAFYKYSHGVVVPTLYEAGSFPVIEAMQLGIPVICASTTSLPETLNNNQLLFDGYSTEQIAQKIAQLWSDESFVERAKQHIDKTALKFKKSSTLNDLLNLYRQQIETADSNKI
jgi:glycosyltransferase involved in cell wall biosynthesis